ncbi:MAG: glycosyltransferase family 9 protein [bacterium]
MLRQSSRPDYHLAMKKGRACPDTLTLNGTVSNGVVLVPSTTQPILPADFEPRRIAIIKPSALGDVVMSLPVLNAARQVWPNARISWIINKNLVGLLDHHPGIDELITFDRRGFGSGIGGAVRFFGWLWSLRQHNFDMVIDLQGLLRSGLMARATGARYRVGLAESREGSTRFYTHKVDTIDIPSGDVHAVERLMRLSAGLGMTKPGDKPSFFWPRTLRTQAWARNTLESLPRPWIGYTIGARWQTKRWPVEQFVKVAEMTRASFGGSVILIGGQEDMLLSQKFMAEARDRLGPVTNLIGSTTLHELQSICGEIDLLVTNDTGPLHVAAATGTPTVGIFTCTRTARTGAYAPNAAAVTTKVDCAGSLQKTCSHTKCFGELDSRRVYQAVANQLHGLGFGTKSAVA